MGGECGPQVMVMSVDKGKKMERHVRRADAGLNEADERQVNTKKQMQPR